MQREVEFNNTDANRLSMKLSARRLIRRLRDLTERDGPRGRTSRYDGKGEALQLEFFPARLGELRRRFDIADYTILMVNKAQFAIFTEGRVITVRFDSKRIYLLQFYGFAKVTGDTVVRHRDRASTTDHRQISGYRVGV